MKNIRICHLFKPVTQNQYSRHPTHSPWSCHIYKTVLLPYFNEMHTFLVQKEYNVQRQNHFFIFTLLFLFIRLGAYFFHLLSERKNKEFFLVLNLFIFSWCRLVAYFFHLLSEKKMNWVVISSPREVFVFLYFKV